MLYLQITWPEKRHDRVERADEGAVYVDPGAFLGCFSFSRRLFAGPTKYALKCLRIFPKFEKLTYPFSMPNQEAMEQVRQSRKMGS